MGTDRNPQVTPFVLLIGPSGSGKSTLCQQLIDEQVDPFYNVYSLNRQRLVWAAQRKIIRSYEFWEEPDPEDYTKAFDLAARTSSEFGTWSFRYYRRLMHDAQDSGTPLYIDQMNLKEKTRREYTKAGRKFGLQVMGVHVDTPYETCLERNTRSQRLPDGVMKEHFDHYELPIRAEFDEYRRYEHGVLMEW